MKRHRQFAIAEHNETTDQVADLARFSFDRRVKFETNAHSEASD
jgi:hypothetical protein